MAPRAASLRTAAAPSVRIAQVQRTADALVAHAHLHDASKIATESRNSYIAIEDGHVRVVSSPTLSSNVRVRVPAGVKLVLHPWCSY